MVVYFFFYICARYQVFSDCDDENTNNASVKAEAKDDNSSKEGSEDAQLVSGSNKISSSAEAKDDNSSKEGSEDAQLVSGLNKISSSADEQGARSSEMKKDPEGAKNKLSGCDISEPMIKKAIDKRASYFRENSEYVSSTCHY